jgi:hypothetical protein
MPATTEPIVATPEEMTLAVLQETTFGENPATDLALATFTEFKLEPKFERSESEPHGRRRVPTRRADEVTGSWADELSYQDNELMISLFWSALWTTGAAPISDDDFDLTAATQTIESPDADKFNTLVKGQPIHVTHPGGAGWAVVDVVTGGTPSSVKLIPLDMPPLADGAGVAVTLACSRFISPWKTPFSLMAELRDGDLGEFHGAFGLKANDGEIAIEAGSTVKVSCNFAGSRYVLDDATAGTGTDTAATNNVPMNGDDAWKALIIGGESVTDRFPTKATIKVTVANRAPRTGGRPKLSGPVTIRKGEPMVELSFAFLRTAATKPIRERVNDDSADWAATVLDSAAGQYVIYLPNLAYRPSSAGDKDGTVEDTFDALALWSEDYGYYAVLGALDAT